MFFQSKILYINRLAGVALLSLTSLFMAQHASAQTVVYQDDFEGAVSGWSSNVTENAPLLGTNMLGRFGGSTAETSRTFTVPVGTTALDIEFDLLRFDSWDFYNAANQDGFAVLIDGNTIFSTTASFGTVPRLDFSVGQGPRSGASGNVDWAHVRLNPTDAQVSAGNQEQELGFTTGQYWYDQVHRFTINVNNPGTTVDLTLRFDTDQTINDESAGFDNFLVTAITPTSPTDADLVTVKSLASASATPSEGDIVAFDIEVSNNGGAEATGVSLTDLIPAGLTATGANGTVNAGSYDASTGLWTLGTLANGASATLTIEGTVDAGQVGNTLTNTLAAPASGDQPDPSTVGDDLTESVTIVDSSSGGGGGFCPVGATTMPGTYHVVSATGGNSPNNTVGTPAAEGSTQTNGAVLWSGNMDMDLTGDADILVPEGEVLEVVLSSHWGTQARAEVLMSADGTNYTSLGTAGNGGSVYGAWQSNILRYDDFAVPPGGARYLRLSHQSSGVRADGVLYGTQCLLSAQTDVDLVTVKNLSSASATPNVGDTVTFEIEVSNNGVGEATGVSLTDLIPAGLTATGANGTVSSGSYDAGTGLWTLGTLADGASATLRIEGTVDAGQGGNTITNTLASAALGDQTDSTTDGDDLIETVTVTIPATPVVEAVDNDFTTTAITPGFGGVTASIFDNDTLNDATFTPTDVTVTVIDDGSLFGAVINADGTIDIPATIAPGIYELVYEICDVNDSSNCDIAIATIAIQSVVANAHINPSVCGAFLSQSWIVHGKLNLHDSEVQIGSGDFATDPYLYLPIERDAEGRILTYFGSNDGTDSGTVLTPALAEVSTSQNTAADHESDFQVIVYRLEGAPGTTLTANFNSRAEQDYTGYWIEDTAGNVISASDFQFTTGTSGIGGVGEELPLSFTAPADGIAYLHVAIFDPSAFFGKPVIDNYECPAPSLSMTKVADNPGPHKAGDVVTYTYTVTNDGNQIIENVAITDTHNGSDPAPIPGNETLLTDAAPIGDSTDAGPNNSWDVLAPGDAIVFTGTYTVTAEDVDTL